MSKDNSWPSGHPINLFAEVEAQVIACGLDVMEWLLQGRRNRIFVLMAGKGTVNYEAEDHPIVAPCLVWMPTGNAARLKLQAGSRGAWLALSDTALSQVALPVNVAQDLRHLAQHPQFGTVIKSENAQRLATLMAVMETELRDGLPGAQDMIHHQLAIVCILLWRMSDLLPRAAQPAPRTVVSNFLQLVDQQMRNHWSVADYARYLGVSTDRLNSAVQRAAGRSPLALIHARMISEARQMLENSGMQISEIAMHLGFEDAAYFSRFFKRMSGKSPRQYRADFTKSQTRVSGSFAAWP